MSSSPDSTLTFAARWVHGAFVRSVLVRGGGGVLALVVNVVLARTLGVTEFGHYMTILSVTLLLGGLAVRGSDQLLTRELANRANSGEDLREGLARWVVGRVGRSSALAVLLYSGWVFFYESRYPPELLISGLLGGTTVIVSVAFCTLEAGALNGTGASLRSQGLMLVVKNSAMLLLATGVMIALGKVSNAVDALWLQAIACVGALVVGWSWLRSLTTTHAYLWQKRSPRAGAHVVRNWSSSSRHFLLVTLASLLVNRLDVVLISTLASNESVGVYAAGARLAQLSLMIAVAVNVVLSPKIAAAWSHGDRDTVRSLFREGLRFTIPVAVVEIALALFFARDVIALFGPGYSEAAVPFAWVMVAYAIWTAAAPGYALLAMTGSERAVATLSWLVLIANVVAIFGLVPIYGATGGGIAMAVGYVLVMPILAILSRSKLSKPDFIAGV